MSAGPPGQVIIGLDVGTTGVKAAAFGIGSSWRTVAIREYPLLHPGRDREVQDPAAILSACADALGECVRSARSAEVLAVSVSAAMHGLMALDPELRPLTPLITWADSRAREEAKSLRESERGRMLHALTGAPIHPMTPLTKLMWFARHDPETVRAARWWIGLKDRVLLWLTGRLVTELSSAGGTGLLDMSRRDWSHDALDVAGVRAGSLPPILSTTALLELAPATAKQVGLPAGTPVVAGAGDGPLANLGTGAIEPGVAGMSLGTSGAVRMAVDGPRIDPERTLFCFALTDSLWIAGGAISNGGAVLRWAGQALAADVRAGAAAGEADSAVLDLAASVPAGSEGLVMLPYVLPERAPLWDPDLPGSYLGVRVEHTRAHLVRAALEGICMQMRIVLDRLDDVDHVGHVRATGGVFRSALMRSLMAAMLDRPIHIVGEAEGTALGAAALGLLAIGRADTLASALAALEGAGGARTETVTPQRELAATYDRLRAAVPERIAQLERVGQLFAPGPKGGAPTAAG